MSRIVRMLRDLAENEEGHAAPGLLSTVGAVGAIVLGIGAAEDSSVAAIIGGVVLGVGVLGAGIAEHLTVDYDIYRRLDELEK